MPQVHRPAQRSGALAQLAADCGQRGPGGVSSAGTTSASRVAGGYRVLRADAQPKTSGRAGDAPPAQDAPALVESHSARCR